MIREVDLVSYLPPFLAEYKELRETLTAENPEFRIFWEEADRALRNEFIATADEFGISRFEKMRGLLPSREDTLEDRRARVLLKFNTRRRYTVRGLREVIASAAGEGNYYIRLIPEEYRMIVQIQNLDIRLVRIIFSTILPMFPANIILLYYGRYVEKCELSIRQAVSVRFQTSFYPRLNLPQLKLSGKWKLNGERKLSGYDSQGTVDLYPVSARFQVGVSTVPEEKTRLCLPYSVGSKDSVKTRSAVSVKASAEGGPDSREQVGIKMSAACTAEAGEIRIYNKNLLGGGWKLNGGRKLNGGTEIR